MALYMFSVSWLSFKLFVETEIAPAYYSLIHNMNISLDQIDYIKYLDHIINKYNSGRLRNYGHPGAKGKRKGAQTAADYGCRQTSFFR
jgi:hypothetical protein